MNPSTTLSIIIVNWNTRDLLAQCLASVEQNVQSLPQVEVETVVVDNGSTDGSPVMVKSRFPQVTLLENRQNVGFAQANNQALKQCTGQYLLLLNSDTELLDGALAALVTFADEHPGAGVVGPLLLNGDGSLQPSAQPMLTPGREFWRLSFLDWIMRQATYDMKRWNRNEARPVEVLKGACLLLRREALDQVGLLDEAYFMYTEEVDLCYRLAVAGWELWWVPQARVIHYGAASSKQVGQEMYIQLYKSKVQFYRKFGGASRANHFKQFVRLAYWPRFALAVFLSPFFPNQGTRAAIYRRLLSELAFM